MKEYIIIHNKIIPPQNLKINLIEGKRQYSKEISKIIKEYWKIATKKNGKLFNGKAFSYIKSHIEKQNLIVTIQETDFMSYAGTNLNPHFDKSNEEMANVLGITTILHTADDKFLMGKRSKFVSEGKNLWHSIGGNLDSENIVSGMIKELKEEVNISADKLEKFLIIGLIKNCRNHRPEMLFYTKTSLISKEIEINMDNSIDRFEHSEIRFFSESQFYDLQFLKQITFTAKGIIKAFFDNKNLIMELR